MVVAMLAGLGVAGCGEGRQQAPSAEQEVAPESPTTASSKASPAGLKYGTLDLAAGVSVNYQCVGEGAPAILLEAGTDDGGTESYPSEFVDPLARVTTVCTYDRLGTAQSSRPPARKRNLDDVCEVEDQVLAALKLSKYVLVGQSGGGNTVIWCAARHPERVAALVTIDAYHDDPKRMAAEGFRWQDNPENVDYVETSTMLDEMDMPVGDFPVLVFSATDAEPGGVKNQKFWLSLSPHARQVVVEGGHDLHREAPDPLVEEILKVLPKR